ncbi:MAG: hypothetical protein CSA97_05285 [Bacteroidetes bacterium]|nr:MAG: hypothetical protein CSA97_05285 [Bacteroidota bacterium]
MSWLKPSRVRPSSQPIGRNQSSYMGGRIRWSLLLALPLLLLVSSCKKPQSPEFTRLVNFGIGQDENGDWGINLDIKAKNPNRRSVRLTKTSFNVWLDSTPLATIKLKEQVKLPGRSDTTIHIPLVIAFRSKSDELRLLFGALMSGGKPNIELEGDIKVRLGIYGYQLHLGRQGMGTLFRQLGLPPPKGPF